MSNPVRVRFAPSPTGGLHLGGVRTALYNYLFAHKHGGKFILRVEDTDQTRFVEGAEEYILECLKWCGIEPDESPMHGGDYGPYRQSERKPQYRQYAEQLVQQGHAYYAFDTPAALEAMRIDFKTTENPSPQYGQGIREKMKNSMTLSEVEVEKLIADGVPYVVRIKMPTDEVIGFTDLIRGAVNFNTSTVDDKVLLKADGMPTYHLAVVVDDYLMKITHAFRGEEWLNSAPVHLLLWKYLGWEDVMPEWAHLPLLLGPDGAKLSKRHGNKYGFPIFAMNWTDKVRNDFTEGFRERGFLPAAFINLLAVLGWNDGTSKEIYSKQELIEAFDMTHVHKGGAQFDFEKAKWYNHEWLKLASDEEIANALGQFEPEHYVNLEVRYLLEVIGMIKDRCTLLSDFWQQGSFFFQAPETVDVSPIQAKWNDAKTSFFDILKEKLLVLNDWLPANLEAIFKQTAEEKEIKMGELQLPFRIMLVGGKFGPGVFDIAGMIGKECTIHRIQNGIALLIK